MAENKDNIEAQLLMRLKSPQPLSLPELRIYFSFVIENNKHELVKKILERTPKNLKTEEALPNTLWGDFFLLACKKKKPAIVTQMMQYGIKIPKETMMAVLKVLFESIEKQIHLKGAENVNPDLLMFTTFLINFSKMNGIALDMNWHTKSGKTPLSLALKAEKRSYSMLMESLEIDQPPLVKALLTLDSINVDLPNFDNNTQKWRDTLLIESILRSKWWEVSILLKAGADFTKKANNGYSGLDLMATNQEDSTQGRETRGELFKRMLQTNETSDTELSDLRRLLSLSLQFKNPDLCYLVLKKGGKDLIDAKTTPGMLRLAIFFAGQRQPDREIFNAMAELLVTSGVSLQARDEYGFTPIENAANLGLRSMVDFLLSQGASPDRSGELLTAYQNRLKEKADSLFAPDEEKPTLANFIETESLERVIKYINSHTISPNDLQDALAPVVINKKQELFDYLLDLGADPHAFHRYLMEISATTTADKLDEMLKNRDELLKERREALDLHQKKHPVASTSVELHPKQQVVGGGDMATFQYALHKEMTSEVKESREEVVRRIKEAMLQDKLRPQVFRAIEKEDKKELLDLIKKGANLNFSGPEEGGTDMIFFGEYALDLFGYTPLHFACYLGKPHMFNFLVSVGADIDHTNERVQKLFQKPLKEIKMPPKSRLLLLDAIDRAEQEAFVAKDNLLYSSFDNLNP